MALWADHFTRLKFSICLQLEIVWLLLDFWDFKWELWGIFHVKWKTSVFGPTKIKVLIFQTQLFSCLNFFKKQTNLFWISKILIRYWVSVANIISKFWFYFQAALNSCNTVLKGLRYFTAYFSKTSMVSFVIFSFVYIFFISGADHPPSKFFCKYFFW